MTETVDLTSIQPTECCGFGETLMSIGEKCSLVFCLQVGTQKNCCYFGCSVLVMRLLTSLCVWYSKSLSVHLLVDITLRRSMSENIGRAVSCVVC